MSNLDNSQRAASSQEGKTMNLKDKYYKALYNKENKYTEYQLAKLAKEDIIGKILDTFKSIKSNERFIEEGNKSYHLLQAKKDDEAAISAINSWNKIVKETTERNQYLTKLLDELEKEQDLLVKKVIETCRAYEEACDQLQDVIEEMEITQEETIEETQEETIEEAMEEAAITTVNSKITIKGFIMKINSLYNKIKNRILIRLD